MRNKLFLFAYLVLIVVLLQAQDIHFSQFQMSPHTVNPSLNGLYSGDYRVIINNRQQWSQIGRAFSTFCSSYEINLLKNSKRYSTVTLLVDNDVSGDSEFESLSFGFGFSHHNNIDNNRRLLMSFGMQLYYTQNTIDYDKLKFASQHNGEYFDSRLPTFENFQVYNFSFADFSAGFNIQKRIGESNRLNIGFSSYHINKPKFNFSNSDDIKLSLRHTLSISYRKRLSNTYYLIPSGLIHSQGVFKEVLFGLMNRVSINKTEIDEGKGLYFGVYYRFLDALIFSSIYEYSGFQLAMTFDLTTSKLYIADNGFGAIEISAAYKFNAKKLTRVIQYKTCPAFL